MNKIVLKHYPASKLPEELRSGLAADASVRVTVEEEAVPSASSVEELGRQLQDVRRNLRSRVPLEEAVRRIRELRDEWDD